MKVTALNREAIIAHRAVTASRVVIGGGHAAKFRTFDPSPIPWQVAAFEDRAPILLLTGSAGGGKALALTTPIPTPNGWATMASLMPGDSVFDECGQPCRVLATSEIMYGREVFDVYFDDGSVIRADGEHLWLTSTVASRASKRNNPFPVPTEFKLRGSPQVRKTDAIVTTKHIRETLRTVATSRRINHAVCNAAPLQLPEVLVPIPSYVLGAWLGDGTSKAGEITGIDQPIFDRIASFGYRVAPQPTQRMRQTIYGLQASLRALGVLNNKHIPSVYLRASEHQRRELLWGLMDTDGTALPSGSVEFYSTNRRLVEGVLELIHSLGFKASICTGRAMLYDKDCGEKYRIKFTTSEPVFALKRKIERQVSKERGVQRRRFIIDVVPVPTEPVRCIEVSSSSGLFLAGRDMIPTHNSRLGYEMGHNFMVTHPGAMGLMVRKTRESMRNSTVLFFKSRIADQDSRVELVTSSHRFQYTNGSFLAYGGMKDEDQREQIRSIGVDGALDFALIEEANRLTFEDFQEIFPRMRGKAGPYCQLILMTNPDAPRHWINEKLIKGGMAKVYYSSAGDNPFNPPEYAAWLNMLTGVQRRRLVEGKWEQAEGVIYDNFSAIVDDSSTNVTAAAEYNPALGIVLWGCDDGYARGDGPGTLSYHPRIILLAQETAQGGLNIFDEYYRVEEPSYEASINDVLARGYPMPGAAFCDSSAAMFRANLMNRGIMTSGATHSVTEGIRNLRRLICDAKGMRLLKIHPRCVNLISEFQSYRYDDTAQVAGDRKPLKMDDHGVDSARYLAWHLRYEMVSR